MMSIRLIPLVIVAASSLFALRTLSLVSDGGLNLLGASSAIAQQSDENIAENLDVNKPEMTGAIAAPTNEQDSSASKVDLTEFTQSEIQALAQSGISESEVQLLLRLRNRREELEARERQLKLRESMLEAMEGNLQSKIKTLENSEGFSNLDENGKPKNPDKKIEQLVTVYEAMKPKDAARILSRLDVSVLTRLARAMKPRKISAILAQMDSQSAEKLTLALVGSANSPDLNSLPQIGRGS